MEQLESVASLTAIRRHETDGTASTGDHNIKEQATGVTFACCARGTLDQCRTPVLAHRSSQPRQKPKSAIRALTLSLPVSASPAPQR